jgi:hypothetical protein
MFSSSQNPALKSITANACIFWSNIVSANKPSITPPNAIKSGGAKELITLNGPGYTNTPKSENAYIFNDADSINGTSVDQANGNVEPPAVCFHLKLKVAL